MVAARQARQWKPTLVLSLALFVLWIILSGEFDAFHLVVGAGSAVCITLGTRRLLTLQPVIGVEGTHPALTIPWFHLPGYIVWLSWQVVLAGLQVAAVVLHPRLPISPRIVRFRTVLPHTLARLTLANSITLTPGTVTLDVQGDEFTVHALTEEHATGIAPTTGESPMLHRVAALYASSSRSRNMGASG
jgi:multicomponent Na+:H+ antiporter subunit E